MKLYALTLCALALLAGCDSPQPVAPDAAPRSALDDPPAIPVMGPQVPILALGDSLLAGYGLNEGESFPAQLEVALRVRGINARIVNAGVSGDTSAAGLQRLSFTLDAQPVAPTLVMISLGGNDMLRGIPPQQTRANLDAILTELARRKIKSLLLGMIAAPNLGKDYAAQFDPIYPDLAKKHGAALVPFFLAPVIEHDELLLADHIHPTEPGVDVLVAETIDAVAAALP